MKDLFIKNPKIIFSLIFSMVVAAGGVGMFYLINGSSREALYYNLSQEDAAKIVEKLKENKVDYKLENGGRTVLVDPDKVAEIRLMLASNGLPSQSGSGFEIFDKNRLGLSGFAERVNYRRALEGELSRSISSIEGVKYARVHIAMPEPNIFVGKQEAASASVVVHTYKNFSLNSEQIKGIVNLVSGAVEGLKSDNVSITDGEGRLIKPMGEDWEGNFANEAKIQTEKNISNKISEVLDKIYGAGKTIVSVDVSLDLDKLESVKEIYNPKTVLTSASSNSEESSQGESKSKRNSSDMRYLTDKTVEKFVKRGGNIKKMSISVAVSSDVAQTEITKIRELVSSASGFDPSRGDAISVNFFNFSKPEKDLNQGDADYMAWKKEFEKKQMIKDIVKYSSFILSALIITFGLYLFSARLLKSQEVVGETAKVQIAANTQNESKQTGDSLNNKEKEAQTAKTVAESKNPKKEFADMISRNSKDVSRFLEEYIESNSARKETANV
ncbi:MAG: flagellar basal-body MS-ring/collar protein FliF [Elusimicrobiota bacterium]